MPIKSNSRIKSLLASHRRHTKKFAVFTDVDMDAFRVSYEENVKKGRLYSERKQKSSSSLSCTDHRPGEPLLSQETLCLDDGDNNTRPTPTNDPATYIAPKRPRTEPKASPMSTLLTEINKWDPAEEMACCYAPSNEEIRSMARDGMWWMCTNDKLQPMARSWTLPLAQLAESETGGTLRISNGTFNAVVFFGSDETASSVITSAGLSPTNVYRFTLTEKDRDGLTLDDASEEVENAIYFSMLGVGVHTEAASIVHRLAYDECRPSWTVCMSMEKATSHLGKYLERCMLPEAAIQQACIECTSLLCKAAKMGYILLDAKRANVLFFQGEGADADRFALCDFDATFSVRYGQIRGAGDWQVAAFLNCLLLSAHVINDSNQRVVDIWRKTTAPILRTLMERAGVEDGRCALDMPLVRVEMCDEPATSLFVAQRHLACVCTNYFFGNVPLTCEEKQSNRPGFARHWISRQAELDKHWSVLKNKNSWPAWRSWRRGDRTSMLMQLLSFVQGECSNPASK